MDDSILITIRKMLGMEEDDNVYDTDIIVHINSAFSRLKRLGVGPAEGFSISDEMPTWSEYIEDNLELSDVKTYIYLKVKTVFDPPTNSSVLASMERMITQLEWELNVTAESGEEEE